MRQDSSYVKYARLGSLIPVPGTFPPGDLDPDGSQRANTLRAVSTSRSCPTEPASDGAVEALKQRPIDKDDPVTVIVDVVPLEVTKDGDLREGERIFMAPELIHLFPRVTAAECDDLFRAARRTRHARGMWWCAPPLRPSASDVYPPTHPSAIALYPTPSTNARA
jgi:hypothetical protein